MAPSMIDNDPVCQQTEVKVRSRVWILEDDQQLKRWFFSRLIQFFSTCATALSGRPRIYRPTTISPPPELPVLSCRYSRQPLCPQHIINFHFNCYTYNTCYTCLHTPKSKPEDDASHIKTLCVQRPLRDEVWCYIQCKACDRCRYPTGS